MKRGFAVLLLTAAVGAAAASALYHHSEARRLHGRLTALSERCRLLESQLADALRVREGVTEALDRAVDEQHARLAAAERTPIGMPEGVRLALVALNDCLRDDAHGGLRFFFARAIEDHVLRGVELVDRDAAALRTRVWLADRVEIRLQRDARQLTIRLADGEVVSGGERRPLVADGETITLADVDGPLWEGRCPLVVTATGDYPPEPDPVQERRRQRLEEEAAVGWLERFDDLLDRAGTDLRLHVAHVGGLADGSFHDVLLLGYDAGRKLALAAEAARMSVVAGPGSSVELLLEDGVLRRAGGDTTIPARGYSILLPSLRPDEAIDLMLGMVVRR